MKQEQTSGRNIKPEKDMTYRNLQHIENQWSQSSPLCLSHRDSQDRGSQDVHAGVLWSLLLGRGPHRQMPTLRSRGSLGSFFRPPGSSEDSVGLVASSFPFPASCGSTPQLRPFFLSPCLPSHRPTVLYVLPLHTSQPSHTTYIYAPLRPTLLCLCNIHGHTHMPYFLDGLLLAERPVP